MAHAKSPAKTAVNKPARARTKKISTEARHQMIAEAAYYRAEQRGFSGGDDVQDWLDAEIDIDQRLKP